MSTHQAPSEVVTDYTRDELRMLITRYSGRSLSVSQFYRWLPYALVKRAQTYSPRDAKKLLFLAMQLNRVRDFEFARAKLIQDLENNPHQYSEDFYNDCTINL